MRTQSPRLCVFFSFSITFQVALSIIPKASQANLPALIKNQEFRSHLASALADGASSFDYRTSSQALTFALECESKCAEFRTHQIQQDQIKILLAPTTGFEVLPIEATALGPLSAIRVKLPQGVEPSFFNFRIIPFETEVKEQDLDPDGPQLTKQIQLRLRLEVIRLTKSFTAEFNKKSHQGDAGPLPPSRAIEWIKSKILPMELGTFPPIVYLRLLQETRALSPAFKFRPELIPSAANTSTDTSSIEYQNCLQLGGILTTYTLEQNKALLCRFGDAGVGGAALLNYRNRQAVKSIGAFLDYKLPENSEKNDLAIIPRPGSESGELGPFVLQPNPRPEILQPGIRMVMPPKIQISAYCRQRGGKPTQLRNPADGTPLKACIFDDFSGIDATTLYRGPSDPRNAKLLQALSSLR